MFLLRYEVFNEQILKRRSLRSRSVFSFPGPVVRHRITIHSTGTKAPDDVAIYVH
jgi:hypothetical protein